jgi:hypothetical protein
MSFIVIFQNATLSKTFMKCREKVSNAVLPVNKSADSTLSEKFEGELLMDAALAIYLGANLCIDAAIIMDDKRKAVANLFYKGVLMVAKPLPIFLLGFVNDRNVTINRPLWILALVAYLYRFAVKGSKR